MSEPDEEDSVEVNSEAANTDVQQNAITSNYKILGELNSSDGVGVLGQNDADSGTPIGVQGAVPNSSAGFGFHTPDDVHVGGYLATDSYWLLKVGNDTVVEIDNGYTGSTISGGRENSISYEYTTIGGGKGNGAGGQYSTVSGGHNNSANGAVDAIGGG